MSSLCGRRRLHRRHRIAVHLTGPDPVDLLDRQDEDLAVSNRPRSGRREDGLDGGLHEGHR